MNRKSLQLKIDISVVFKLKIGRFLDFLWTPTPGKGKLHQAAGALASSDGTRKHSLVGSLHSVHGARAQLRYAAATLAPVSSAPTYNSTQTSACSCIQRRGLASTLLQPQHCPPAPFATKRASSVILDSRPPLQHRLPPPLEND